MTVVVATEIDPTEIAHLTALAIQATKTIAIVIDIVPLEIGPTVVIATVDTIVTTGMTVIVMTATAIMMTALLVLVTQGASRITMTITMWMIVPLAVTRAAALGHMVTHTPPVALQAQTILCTAKTMMITTSLMHIMVN